MSKNNEKPKQNKEVTKKPTLNREKPVAVMLLYKKDAVAMGFEGNEKDVSALVKNKIRQTLALPTPERSSGQNSVLKVQLGLSPDATNNELNKVLKQAILSGRFTPKQN